MVNRRDFLAGGPFFVGSGLFPGSGTPYQATKEPVLAALDLSASGLSPHSKKPQTALLQELINKAALEGRALILPKGDFLSGPLLLPSSLTLRGAGAGTRLIFSGGPSFFLAQNKQSITLSELTIEGAGKPLGQSDHQGLIHFEECRDVHIERCSVRDSGLNGISLARSSGRVVTCVIEGARDAGLFAIDSAGLEISSNYVFGCDNNGILVWRSEKGYDGTLITNNRISAISAKDGGTGERGNGINIFRAGSVLVGHNVITDCTFSAVRNNGGDNVQIVSNHCERLGEVALYSEFVFEGAIINNNLVDGAHVGISITNYNEGGRLATATGNLIRRIKARAGVPAIGIGVEADTLVSGNVIEEVEGFGISAGNGKYLRDVTLTNNLIRRADVGIGVTTDNEAGFALITTNMITGAKNGGIRPVEAFKPFGPDLAKTSSEAFLNLAVYGNVSL